MNGVQFLIAMYFETQTPLMTLHTQKMNHCNKAVFCTDALPNFQHWSKILQIDTLAKFRISTVKKQIIWNVASLHKGRSRIKLF